MMPAGTLASAECGTGVERQEMFHNQFKKTVVCRFFFNNACKRGTKCTFAHSAAELQDVPDLRKTALCKQWKQGMCRFFAEDCPFAHGKHELRMSQAFMQHSTAKRLPPSMPSSESTWSIASGSSSQSLPSIESSPRLNEASVQTSFAESRLAPATPPQPNFSSLRTWKHHTNSVMGSHMEPPGLPTPEETEPAFVEVDAAPPLDGAFGAFGFANTTAAPGLAKSAGLFETCSRLLTPAPPVPAPGPAFVEVSNTFGYAPGGLNEPSYMASTDAEIMAPWPPTKLSPSLGMSLQ
jgi:hypothetical protein